MKKRKSSVFFLMLSYYSLYAQESTLSTGNTASGSGGNISYSIGQVSYQQQIGSNASVAQGVQQPYEWMVVSGIDEKEIQLIINAYPNPTSQFLTIQVDNLNQKNLVYYLSDSDGKLIFSNKIINELTPIYMNQLSVANYFLTIKEDDQQIKIFKIIKN